jgi:flagellar assembly protein FliH
MAVINMSLNMNAFAEIRTQKKFVNIFDKPCGTQWTPSIATSDEPSQSEPAPSYEQGYQDGLEQGRLLTIESALLEARKKFDQDLNSVRQYTVQIEQALKEIEENALHDSIQLALEIARKMTLSNLTLNTTAVLPIIKHAISLLPAVTKVYEIHLNPVDVIRLKSQLKTELNNNQLVTISDESIESGGCMVVSPTNKIDATNQYRWSQINKLLNSTCEWLKP